LYKNQDQQLLQNDPKWYGPNGKKLLDEIFDQQTNVMARVVEIKDVDSQILTAKKIKDPILLDLAQKTYERMLRWDNAALNKDPLFYGEKGKAEIVRLMNKVKSDL